MWQVSKELLLPLRHTMHGRTSKALETVETSTHSYQTKAPLNEALGTVETSNHSYNSYQTKAPLNEALGTVETSNDSYQTKAPLNEVVGQHNY